MKILFWLVSLIVIVVIIACAITFTIGNKNSYHPGFILDDIPNTTETIK